MPPHALGPIARLLERPRRLSLAVLVIGLVLIPTAAASLSAAGGSDRGARELAKGGKQRWIGALTEADQIAARLGNRTTMSSAAPSFRVVELGTLGGSVPMTVGPYTGEPWDINNLGTIVGQAIKPGGAYRPFIYRRGDSTMTELTAVGGVLSWALGVGESDKVVGSNSVGSGPDLHPARVSLGRRSRH